MNVTARRIGATFLLTVGVWLALEGVGQAARKPRCGTIQRRAQSKLEEGLAGCAEKGASAAIATCSTERWNKYARQLRRSRCPVAASSGRLGNPLLSKVRAEGVSADDLADADVESRNAQLALRDVLRRLAAAVEAVRRGHRRESSLAPFAGELSTAVERVADAEQRLVDVETALWGGLRGDPFLSWLIDEPLRVAMEQLQVEVRRLLDPDFRTEIEALRDEPGCAGDIIGDRLIAEYGRAVLAPGDDGAADVAALGRMAAQLACISFRQASLLDLALGVAYDMVATRLERAGLGRIEDALARYFAPLELLVFDTVKLGGDHAHAWHWFKDHRVALRDEISRLGWPTDDVVWLYDRIDGKLVGFPQCASDDFQRCVDVPAFLDSLADPRAIGLGDCALAGMVAGGLKGTGGASLYACPSADCGADESRPVKGGPGSGLPPFGGRSGAGGSRRGSVGGGPGTGASESAIGALPWSGLTAEDLSGMYELGCRGIGGGGGAGGTGDDGATQGRGGHGGVGDTEDCVEEAIHAPRDPYAAYTQCVAAAAGHSGPTATLDLEGVPMAPECSPSVADEPAAGGGGGGATSTTTPPASSSSTTVAASDTSTTTEPPSASPPCVPSGILDAISKLLDCGLPVLQMALSSETPKVTTRGGPTPATAAGAVVGAELTLLDPQNAQNAYEGIGANLKRQIELECADGSRLSAAECATLDTMKPGDAAEYLRMKGLIKDCAPDAECEAVCTGVDEQVKQRLDDCQRRLDETLRGDPVTEDDLDARINPAPDADTGGVPAGPLTSCLLAGAPGGSGGANLGCGLVLCADGVASTGRSASACCGQAAPALGVAVGRLLLERTCDQVQCGGDETAVADGLGACGCGSAAGGIGGGGGAPTPQPDPRNP